MENNKKKVEHSKHVIPDNVPGVRSTSEKKKQMSKNELIDILVDLANDNPDRSISRAFYRQEVGPDSLWVGHFGNFPEYQRAAKLNPTRETNKILNKAARYASLDETRKMDTERWSFVDKFKKADNGKRVKYIVAVSDMHDVECDPFYRRVATETVKMIQPDVVCLDGDIFDCMENSSHPKDPRDWDVEYHTKFGEGIVRDFREAAPDATLDLIEGNHEYRLARETLEYSPALASMLDMRGIGISQLFGLDQYECNYIAKGTLATFTKSEMTRELFKNHKIYYDCVYATHFPEGRGKSGFPGFNGHHHQHIVWTEYNNHFGSYEWHQMGAGHKRRASYCDGSKWNSGFLVIEVDTAINQPIFHYVTVGTTMARSMGQLFIREPDEFYPHLMDELPGGKIPKL